jgi:hypothetical protein
VGEKPGSCLTPVGVEFHDFEARIGTRISETSGASKSAAMLDSQLRKSRRKRLAGVCGRAKAFVTRVQAGFPNEILRPTCIADSCITAGKKMPGEALVEAA